MANVVVDLGTNLGPVTLNASGLLHSLTAKVGVDVWPDDQKITDLKVALWRLSNYSSLNASPDDTYPRLKALLPNITLQLLTDNYLLFADNPYWVGATFDQTDGHYIPGNGNGTYPTIEAGMAALMDHLIAVGQTDYIIDPLNEWDAPKFTYAQGIDWIKRCCTVARQKVPNIRIATPSLGAYDFTRITNTLLDLHAIGIDVYSVTWHELLRAPEESNSANPDLYSNVEEMATWLSQHPELNVQEICIQEYTNPYFYVYSPGSSVDHFAAIERLGRQFGIRVTAIRASWYEIKEVDIGPNDNPPVPYCNSGLNPTLDGLLTYDKHGQPYSYPPAQRTSEKRGTYWAHYTYAHMPGNFVTVTRTQDFDALASKDSASGVAQILACSRQGRTAGSDSFNLVINNIPSYLINGSNQVIAKVESIPQTEAGLPSLPVVSNQGYTVSNNSITIPMSISQFDASKVTLTGVGTGNQNPIANAGPDQTVSTSTATLAGIASDPDGTIVSHVWSKVSGNGSITTPNAYNSGLTGLNGVSVFLLTVTDDQGATATDTVTITANIPVTPSGPVTVKGRRIVLGSGSTVSTDGFYAAHTMVAYLPQVQLEGGTLAAGMDRWLQEQKDSGYNLQWAHNDRYYESAQIAAMIEMMDSANRLGGIPIMPGYAGGTPSAEVVQLFQDTWNKSALFKINGKRVFSCYDYNPTNQVAFNTALTNAGYPKSQYLLWVHSRYPTNSFAGSVSDVEGVYDNNSSIDGLINFAVDQVQDYANQNAAVIATNNYSNTASRNKSKLYMAGTNAYYTAPPGSGRNDFGFAGLAQIWEQVLGLPVNQRPRGICDTTSNDYGELSYMSTPVQPVKTGDVNSVNMKGMFFLPYLGAGYNLGANVGRYPLADHSGIQKFQRPYVDAFLNKQSSPTITTERIFCWYWLHMFGTAPTSTKPTFFNSYSAQDQTWWNTTKYSPGSSDTERGTFEKLYTEGSVNGNRIIPGYGRIRMAAHLTTAGYLKINNTLSTLQQPGIRFFDIAEALGIPSFSIIGSDGTTVRMTGNGLQAITNNVWPGGWNFISTEV